MGAPAAHDDTDTEIQYTLYVAARELEGIPFTAPEVLVARLRQIAPLASSLLDRARAAEAECDKLRTALATVLDILGDPADDEACALQCLGPQVIAAARGALL